MVEYPHSLYLRYLVTKKMSHAEIENECVRLELYPPAHDDIIAIKASIGVFPSSWKYAIDETNFGACSTQGRTRKVMFMCWLKRQGVLPLWKNKFAVPSARAFIYKRAIRKDFETLFLIHKEIEPCREQLKKKYLLADIPNKLVLAAYTRIFWNVHNISPESLFEYIRNTQEEAAHVAAVSGDTSVAYTHMGMSKPISSEVFYDNLISLADQQVQYARMATEMLPGSTLMGIAAITRQALEAIRGREDIALGGKVEVLEAIRDQASAFRARIIESPNILTIEDLDHGDTAALTLVGD